MAGFQKATAIIAFDNYER